MTGLAWNVLLVWDEADLVMHRLHPGGTATDLNGHGPLLLRTSV